MRYLAVSALLSVPRRAPEGSSPLSLEQQFVV